MQSEVIAPPAWQRIDFISDLHLAADTPATFEAWASYLRETPAEAVFILGDLFEAWVGDDSRFEGFEARCAEVLAAASAARWIGFMVGNRDFLVGEEMLQACGVSPLADPCTLVAFGQRLMLTHGDELCLADAGYLEFRAMVRNPAWQAQALALPLDARRKIARDMRHQSEARNRGDADAGDWADVDAPAAVEWMQRHQATTMIHGHTHRPGSEPFGDAGHVRHVLTDWDLDHSPHRAEVLRLSSHGVTRLPLQDALRA